MALQTQDLNNYIPTALLYIGSGKDTDETKMQRKPIILLNWGMMA